MNVRTHAKNAFPIRAESASTGKTSCPRSVERKGMERFKGHVQFVENDDGSIGPSSIHPIVSACFFPVFRIDSLARRTAQSTATSQSHSRARGRRPPVYSDILTQCRLRLQPCFFPPRPQILEGHAWAIATAFRSGIGPMSPLALERPSSGRLTSHSLN